MKLRNLWLQKLIFNFYKFLKDDAIFRFVRNSGAVDQVSARKFLEAARNSGDEQVFFSVYKFFEQRNLRLRGSPAFSKGKDFVKQLSSY